MNSNRKMEMENKSKVSGYEWLAVFLLCIPSLIFRAYVVTLIWAWFIVPFYSVQALTIPFALGIMALVSILFKRVNNESSETPFKDLMVSAFGSAYFLLFAYIVQLFIK